MGAQHQAAEPPPEQSDFTDSIAENKRTRLPARCVGDHGGGRPSVHVGRKLFDVAHRRARERRRWDRWLCSIRHARWIEVYEMAGLVLVDVVRQIRAKPLEPL